MSKCIFDTRVVTDWIVVSLQISSANASASASANNWTIKYDTFFLGGILNIVFYRMSIKLWLFGIIIFDMMGKKLKTITLTDTETKINLKDLHLIPNTYIINVMEKNKSVMSRKIILE